MGEVGHGTLSPCAFLSNDDQLCLENFGLSVKKEAELCSKNTVRFYGHKWANASLDPQIKTVT